VLSATRAAVKVWERVGLRRCATKDSSKPTRLGMLYQASLGFHGRARTILRPQTHPSREIHPTRREESVTVLVL
jgi:hypothetical protein